MFRELSDSELNGILDVFGYPRNRIAWAVEVLQGRIDPATIQFEHHQVDRRVYSLTEEQITEAATYAAMEQLRRDVRNGEPSDVDDEGFYMFPGGH